MDLSALLAAVYEETGYQKAGLWKDYYEDGEDALVMQKER